MSPSAIAHRLILCCGDVVVGEANGVASAVDAVLRPKGILLAAIGLDAEFRVVTVNTLPVIADKPTVERVAGLLTEEIRDHLHSR
jgi:hypothetical protein